jgi:UDP-N-acetylmuramoyl-L-alanyl-D-glutamate--2,6-diaminopimelate ligase
LRYGVPSRGDSWAPADIEAHSAHLSFEGTTFQIAPAPRFPALPHQLHIRAIGEIFVENAMAALTAALAAGVPMAHATATLSQVSPPAGRFQVIHEHPHVVVDYAHTPDALLRTLRTARQLCKGRLSLVFGAGGQRDRVKRPLLGGAARGADRVVLTSDNPRNEDPLAIMAEVAQGLDGHGDVVHDADREHAIQVALRDTSPIDVVLIAGKGHERTQEVAGVQSPFSDESIVRNWFESDGRAR